MEGIIAHSDADGIISASIFYKFHPKSSLHFSSHQYLLKSLCNLIFRDYKRVRILDISPNRKTLTIASVFDEVVWIDHHKIEISDIPSNIKLINEYSESTAKLVSKIFGIEDKIVDIANEIDTNNVKSPEAEFFRSLISAIKWKFKQYQNIKFRQIVKMLSFKGFSELEKDESMTKIIEEYNFWLNSNIEKSLSTVKNYEISSKKILIVEGFYGIPVYEIYNRLSTKENFDILIVIYRKIDKFRKIIKSKIEFRGRNGNNVLEIAKKFNGGGHENAAGCTVDYYITHDEIIRNMEEALKSSL